MIGQSSPRAEPNRPDEIYRFRIGVDFDNTVALYERSFGAALGAHSVDPGSRPDKSGMRDRIRETGGELLWQCIQAEVYGHVRDVPVLADGFSEFVRQCRIAGVPIYVISHKTQRAAGDPRLDLRAVAIAWMRDQGFFSRSALGFRESEIFFEDTREAKLQRIAQLGCTHYVDDLLEVLLEPDFPESARPILIDASAPPGSGDGYVTAASWIQIGEIIFGRT